jgi:outer membrane lipoprotein SlyB
MRNIELQCCLLAMLLAGAPALAADSTEAKTAADRYEKDKQICAGETTASVRMQCLRDAREVYDKSFTAAAPAAAPCPECGTVTAVKTDENQGKSGAAGLIAGGVAGAILGHQIGKGHGKDVATIAGAAGGAYAGKKVEEKMTATKVWTVGVRFEDGSERNFSFDHDPGFAAGNAVKATGGSIVRR